MREPDLITHCTYPPCSKVLRIYNPIGDGPFFCSLAHGAKNKEPGSWKDDMPTMRVAGNYTRYETVEAFLASLKEDDR